jgi:hypothetical protein
MITADQAQRIERKLDLIIEHFGITNLPLEIKDEIKKKVLAFKQKQKYIKDNERATIRKE